MQKGFPFTPLKKTRLYEEVAEQIKQYSRDKWEKYWKEKLGIKGYFDIQIEAVELS